jgi:hypothetical protein
MRQFARQVSGILTLPVLAHRRAFLSDYSLILEREYVTTKMRLAAGLVEWFLLSLWTVLLNLKKQPKLKHK